MATYVPEVRVKAYCLCFWAEEEGESEQPVLVFAFLEAEQRQHLKVHDIVLAKS